MISAIRSATSIDAYTEQVLARIEAYAVPLPQYDERRPGLLKEMRPALGTCQNMRAFAEDQSGSECYNVASLCDKDSSLAFCIDCWEFMESDL